MHLSSVFCGASACMLAAGSAAAAVIPYTATSSNPVDGSLSLLSDGVIPPDRTAYNAPTDVSFSNTSTTITFAFNGPVSIGSILATVDNNDTYVFTFFNGGVQSGTARVGSARGLLAGSVTVMSISSIGSNAIVRFWMLGAARRVSVSAAAN